MNSEIFRFNTIRPVQSISSDLSLNKLISLNNNEETLFVSELRNARQNGSRAGIIKAASTFIKSEKYVSGFSNIDPKYKSLAEAVKKLKDSPANTFFKNEFDRIFAADVQKLVGNSDFLALESAVSDSIVCSAIFATVSARIKTQLTYLAYCLYLIRQLAESKLTVTRPSEFQIQIPSGIFPIPVDKDNLKSHREKEKKKAKKVLEDRAKDYLIWSSEIEKNNLAVEELKNAILNCSAEVDANSGSVNGGVSYSMTAASNGSVSEAAFILPLSLSEKLSTSTKEVLTKHGQSLTKVNVARTLTLIESRNRELSTKLYKNTKPGIALVKIGNVLIPTDNFNPESMNPGNQIMAGECSYIPDELLEDDQTTIPSSTTQGGAKILGIADLMVVEQELAGYQMGEVAHIENVLKSELRQRKFKTTNTREETLLTETEETDEKVKDLASTERYELQNEAQNSISESTSRDAGITVSASYGPSVDVTANYDQSTSNSYQDSHTASSNFARETTSKAVSRVEKRKLTRRTIHTIEEVVEVNKHEFDNRGPESVNISGVYRWIEKKYNAQLINYGKRLMLEFVVPEPAAFLRYAITKQPTEQVRFVKPEPPGYCIDNGQRFQPLRAEDITRNNYMFWASKYNVEDITAPPQQNVILSQALTGSEKEGETLGDDTLNSRNFSIEIPEGYYPVRAKVLHNEVNMAHEDGDGNVDTAPPIINILIDNKLVSNGQFPDLTLSYGNWKNIAVAVNILNKAIYAVVVNVFCLLVKEKEEEWQLSVFNAIMNAYNTQKSRYENAVEVAKIRESNSGVLGKNPFINRETEKTELKKGCIALLTGQRFDAFNAMNTNVAPYGYPEIDFEEARTDGSFILFFEQALEWSNMMYLFYPYYWGRKADWIALSQLDDADPLYARFLQAGAARVQVPVRPGFETKLFERIKPGFNWANEGTLVNTENNEPDEMYLSIIDELKNQTGNNMTDGKGFIHVTNGSDLVTGVNTLFSDADKNRRIIIKGKTYVIKSVENETSFTLTVPYAETSATGITYGLGGVLIGQSWEIKLPTNLVKIDNNPI